MTAQAVSSPLARLTPIGLSELNERAALQTRFDRKYVLPTCEVAVLLTRIDPATQVLEIDGARAFAYESVYFDSPDLITYRLAAHKRRRRFKVRTRSYLDSHLCFLEVKTEGCRGSTVKNRLPYRADDRTRVTPGRDFVDTVLTREAMAEPAGIPLLPTLVTRYRRSTMYLPDTGSRVTLDTDLSWEDSRGRLLSLSGFTIVETKTGSTASGVDRLLWAAGHRPVRISKYATGLAALRPDLPAARWRRTLRRYFAAAGPPVATQTTSWRQAS